MKIYLAQLTIAGRNAREDMVESHLQMRTVLLLLWSQWVGGTPDTWYAEKRLSLGAAYTDHEDWFDPNHAHLSITQFHREDFERWDWQNALELKLTTPRLTAARAA
jgi:hypothetical protein